LIDDLGGRAMGVEQRLDPLARTGIACTGPIEIARTLRTAFDRAEADPTGFGNVDIHGRPLCFSSTKEV
jgi:hypothetical protein